MNIEPNASVAPEAADSSTERAFAKVVLRLVKGGPERRAIEAGEVDAVVDRSSGSVILLPVAQRALIEHQLGVRSLIDLSSDGTWEQDEHFRFTSYVGGAGSRAGSDDETFLGKALWELAIDVLGGASWQAHRQQLDWHASFRNFEVRHVDLSGESHYLSFSGEPIIGPGEQLKGYRGITHDITAHKQAEARAVESSRVARLALDSLATQIAVLDANGVIVLANQRWCGPISAGSGFVGDVAVGANYLAACKQADGGERVDGMAIAAGIRQVIEGKRELFHYEHAVGPPGARRWIALSITGADGGAVVSREDITQRKRDEELLELEHRVSRVLAEAGDAGGALKDVIRVICETHAWSCGRYFRFDPVSNLLRFDAAWSGPDDDAKRFLENSRDLVFRPGSGLAGRVFRSRQPLWSSGDGRDARASQTALAPESGRDGALVFPVMARDRPIGVLAFSSKRVCPPEDRLLQAVRSIGDQLGCFLTQRQAMDELRRSEMRFRKMTELSSDFYWQQDRDFRFTEFVGGAFTGGNNVLGRTFWELPSILLEAANWDEHRSRLAAQWSFCDFEFTATGWDGQTDYFCISGEPVYDESGAFTGYCGTGLDFTHRRRTAR